MVVTDASGLVSVESVRCLECGVTYAKPCGGSTMRGNPGCPCCGYVGWIAAAVHVSVDVETRRSYAELRRLRPRPR